MKGLAVCALFVLTVFSASAQSAGDDPVADPKAVVVSGNTRFAVLESRLVRMEWAADGKFEDRATLGVCQQKTACSGLHSEKVRQEADNQNSGHHADIFGK